MEAPVTVKRVAVRVGVVRKDVDGTAEAHAARRVASGGRLPILDRHLIVPLVGILRR